MSIKDNVKAKVESNKTLNRFFGGKKLVLAVGIAAAVLVALGAAIFLNVKNTGKYEVLFPGISVDENTEVYTVLRSRGVDAKRNESGEVTVPEAELGDIMLDMSLLGYPKTALPFNIFSDNTGFTTTEFEKKQYLLLNLQDRLERTLKDMSGISNAIVTLNVSDDSIYVWDEQSSDSTGSVSLTLVPSYELSPEKVAAIKKLVANSVPRLLPENVAVINAVTMEELQGQSLDSGSYYGLDRLDFESKVEKRLEDKIMNVLTLAYKSSQIRVSATVVIDYDKMITENMQYVPQENGSGVVGKSEESKSQGSTQGAGGVAGEENNTDIPSYGTADSGQGGTQSEEYYNNVDYLVGYIKQQIEKDNVKLQKATVSVTVNDNNLTENRKQQLIDTVSKAANIAPEDIVITSFRQTEVQPETVQPEKKETEPQGIVWDRNTLFLAGAGLLILLLLIFLLVHRSRRHNREDEEMFARAENQGDGAAVLERAGEGAVVNTIGSGTQDPVGAIEENPMDQVRSFAKTNPEIIAAMIKSWLKEGNE